MIFKSPHEPVTIPDVSITDYVFARAGDFGDKPALIDAATGRTYSYRELPLLISSLAAGLAAHGVATHDVVAIYAPNSPEYLLAFHAAASLGAITTMVPPLFTGEELRRQLRDSGAKIPADNPTVAGTNTRRGPRRRSDKDFRNRQS